MGDKVKAANLVFYAEQILFECPYCGMNLIKTDYQRIRKLVNYKGAPRGKVCEKCGGTVVLKLNEKAKELIKSRNPDLAAEDDEETTAKLEI